MPGLFTIQIVTLIFPLVQVWKHEKNALAATRALQSYDQEYDLKRTGSTTDTSIATRSSNGKMYSMGSLDACLNAQFEPLQIYASCMELNGENIIFLTKVLAFQTSWDVIFAKAGQDIGRARLRMFRCALNIYLSLVHTSTASYPINIESHIYAHLEKIFGSAATLVATRRSGTPSTPTSAVTPWDEPLEQIESSNDPTGESYHMGVMMLSTPPTRLSNTNESCEHIVSLDDPTNPLDPLATVQIPAEFDMGCFDAAQKSIKYMVWTETWQRFMAWKRSSGIV